jgi:3-hydroxyacyl-CoA dehydrogenase
VASNQDPHFSGSATFFESTLITSSHENNKRASARPIRRVAVLGAGTMGHGIAQVAAAAGSSRLGVTLGLEAMRMVEQGVASARDIDTAMELGYNHPMGPLRLTDLVGLDVRLHIAEYLHGKLGSEAFRPPDILRRMVKEGRLGKKSGEGFYKWNDQETGQRAYTT